MRSVLFVAILTFFPAVGMAQTDFEETAAERGYAPATKDLSNDKTIKIDEPELALVNLTGFKTMPAQKTVTEKG